MAKYFGSAPGGALKVGPSGCGPVAGSGAHAWDPIGLGCWGVTGVRINILDTYDGVMAGMERINWWMSQDSTAPAVPNLLGLPGPIST